jgi:hypothetical protein
VAVRRLWQPCATTFASDAHHPIFSAEMPLFFLACPMKNLSLSLSFPLTRGAVMISATFIVTLGSIVEAKPGAETLCRAVLENKHQGHFTFANSPLDNWVNMSICQYVNMSICQYLTKKYFSLCAPLVPDWCFDPAAMPRGHPSLAMSRAQPPE